MDVGIRFGKPERTVQNAFENIYRYLTIEEFGNLRQTETYGQYTTNEEAVEFMLYKGEDNKIAIVFNIIKAIKKDEKFEDEDLEKGKNILSIFEDETKLICISGDGKDYLKNFAHFMIISRFPRSIEILETGGEKLRPGIDFRHIKAGTIMPSPRITTILKQDDVTTRCTVEEESRERAKKTFKIKIWEKSQTGKDVKEGTQNDDDKYFEKGKKLPEQFKEEIKRCRVAEIIEQYFEAKEQEQQCETKRAEITMTQSEKRL